MKCDNAECEIVPVYLLHCLLCNLGAVESRVAAVGGLPARSCEARCISAQSQLILLLLPQNDT